MIASNGFGRWNRLSRWSTTGFVLSLGFVASSAIAEGPPPTKRVDVTDNLHGVSLVDPYRWLEDQKAPETRAWIDAQNAYTNTVLSRIEGIDPLRKRIAAILKTDSVSLPLVRGEDYFYTRRAADRDQAAIYARRGVHGEPVVLIDPNNWAPDHSTSVTLLDVSDDGKLLAYGVRQGGKDEIEVRLFDVATKKDLPDKLPEARYFGVSIGPEKQHLYFCRHTLNGSRVYQRAIGENDPDETLLFGDGYGPGIIVTPELSDDGKYLLFTVIYGSAADKTELYYRGLEPDKLPRPLITGVDARFRGEIVGETLYLTTNWKAPNNRVLALSLEEPELDKAKEIVPEGRSVIEDARVIGGKLFVHTLENVQSALKVYGLDGKSEGSIELPGLGSVNALSGRPSGKELFFDFSSFATPMTIFRRVVAKGETSRWAGVDAPVDPNDYTVKQVKYPSKDGTMIPMFLVEKKPGGGGPRPTLMTGYGGFNIALTPTFNPAAVAWADQGGVFALPNLRGGGEFGEPWHKAGMREKKQNVFDDFLAAAEYLIKEKITTPAQLGIMGRSNGGLLVGAAMTKRPDLFAAVVCGYPLLDMVRYHRFLVARFWIPEYGSSEDSDQFKYLLAYSPYHQVKPGTKYPATLFVTGDADTRVDPLHARKMAALLQPHASPDRPILLHYDTKAGHSAGRPVSQRVDDLTDELAFLLWRTGALKAKGSP